MDNPAGEVAPLAADNRRERMKFVFLGYYEPAKHAAMTEAEQNAMFDECLAFDDHLRDTGHFAVGEAVQHSETASTVLWNNGKVVITDGPYVETKEHLGGIGIIEAQDLKAAIQLMSQHPALKYGTKFDIRPAFDMDEIRQQSKQRRERRTAP
jgi:hypothetical protein